jgi:prolipoprotein diacylglyceryltransferase
MFHSCLERPQLLLLSEAVYYSLIVTAMACCTVRVYRRLVREGFDRRRVRIFAAFALALLFPVSIAGGKAAALLYHQPALWSRALLLESLRDGNLIAYHGGFLAAVALFAVIIALVGLPFCRVWDVVFIYLPLGHAIGRAGCFMAGCCWGEHLRLVLFGKVLYFKNPTPLYSMAFLLALHVFLNRAYGYFKNRFPEGSCVGMISALYLVLYGLFRFFLEYIRTERVMFAGLTQAQVVMILFVLAGLSIMAGVLVRRRGGTGKEN